MTTASDLNQRIAVQMLAPFEDTRGEETRVWVPWDRTKGGIVWMQANPLRTREFFAAAQAQSEITTRFRGRYNVCRQIDETMRLIWRGKIYDIKGPAQEVAGGHEWIDFLCKAGVVADSKPVV